MKIDSKDGVAIATASFGFLLASLVGFAVGTDHIILWQIGGIIVGAALASSLLASR